jgi:hypothetical protein
LASGGDASAMSCQDGMRMATKTGATMSRSLNEFYYSTNVGQ